MPDPKGNPETTDLDAATAWAHAYREDGPHVVSNARIELFAPYQFSPEQDGREKRRVDLPEKEHVRLPAGAPTARLAYDVQFNGVGKAEYGGALDLHPRLAMKGEDAAREALRERIGDLREEAARRLETTEQYESVLAQEWAVAWPSYWKEFDGELVGVAE